MDKWQLPAEALQEALKNQEKKKGERRVDTEERIEKLNELFGLTRSYNAAAEHVFFDSPSKRDCYRPPSSSSPLDEEETED